MPSPHAPHPMPEQLAAFAAARLSYELENDR